MAATKRSATRRFTVGWLGLAGALLLGAPVAEAQQNKSRTGFRIGEKSKLHLGIDLASSYDTNSRRRPDAEAANSQDVRLLVRPSFEIDVPGTSAAFRIGAGTTFTRFLGVESNADGESLFGFHGDLYLRLGSRKAPVMLTVENTPILTPTVMPDAATISTDERLFRAFTDSGKAFVTLRPGGGALEFDLGYANSYILYIRTEETAPDDGFSHVGFLEARWKFLPKTAMLFKADFGWFEPANPNGNLSTKPSNPFNATVGIIGQITRTISAELRAGYGETLTWNTEERFSETHPGLNQRDLIGTAAVTWQILKTAKWTLAYQRALQPIVALSSMRSDSIRTRLNWGIGQLVLEGYFEYQFRHFGRAETADPADADGLQDQATEGSLMFGGARADYYFTDWLTGGLSYRVMVQDDFNDTVVNSNDAPQLGDFDRHQAWVTVGVHY